MQEHEQTTENGTWRCPFCGELIANEAVLCRFCRSAVVDEHGKQITAEVARKRVQSGSHAGSPDVSLAGALLANLFCPGLGAWKLGSRVRGAVVCAAVFLCVWMAVSSYVNVFQSEFGKAMRTGKTKVLETRLHEAQGTPWATASFWLYVASFVDTGVLWWLREKRRSSMLDADAERCSNQGEQK